MFVCGERVQLCKLLNNLGSVVENWIFWRGIQFSITNNMSRLLDSFFKVKLHLLSLLLVFICISRSKPKRKKKNVVLLLTHKGFSILPLLVFHLSFFFLAQMKNEVSSHSSVLNYIKLDVACWTVCCLVNSFFIPFILKVSQISLECIYQRIIFLTFGYMVKHVFEEMGEWVKKYVFLLAENKFDSKLLFWIKVNILA